VSASQKKSKKKKVATKVIAAKKGIATKRSEVTSEAEQILAAVRKIPRGHVSTYGEIATVAGLPRRARLVGTVLKHAPASKTLPWFRVINSSGRISLPSGSDSYAKQRRKLEAEGVIFRGDRVDMKRYGWPARDHSLDELLWKPA
jgi:methylated-DNA-protein-cysteine methyltransferase related protein